MNVAMRPWARLSIRTRLALVYGGVFFGMGLGLIGISYAIVDHSLSPAATRGTVGQFVAGGGFSGMAPSAGSPIATGQLPPLPQGAPEQALVVQANAQRLLTDVRIATLRSLLLTWAALIGILALAAGLFGWLLSRRMLRPLREITGAARRLSVANLHERIGLEGPRDELRELADTFDGMLARLDSAFASQRRFVANASHELRTPLAIMRTQIDVALDERRVTRHQLLETSLVVRDAVDRCERLLDGLLVLARSDRGLAEKELVDLADAAARALDHVAPLARGLGVELRSDLRAAAVEGDRALLERMVANLVENAVAYNNSTGWVEVVTSNGGSEATVSVTNSGPRVSPDQLPAIFEPFRRLSRDRTHSGRGTGLGLSIVRSVARLHGGEASAKALEPGGLSVEVRVPALVSPAA